MSSLLPLNNIHLKMPTRYWPFGEHLHTVVSSCLAFLLYYNTIKADFVYDDSRAILTNHDLRPETAWIDLLGNDFWGTPLRHSGSHKSYRPLTVATFRLNYYYDQLNPMSYHFVNVLLHTVNTALVSCLARRMSNGNGLVSWIAGLLFSSHPIHTEAVASVVGRADLLATFFFLLCIHAYLKLVQCDNVTTVQRFSTLLCFLLCTTAAVFSKEHGLTVLGVCLLYDLILSSRDHGPNPMAPVSPQQRGHYRQHQTKPMDKQCHSIPHTLMEWVGLRWTSIIRTVTAWTLQRWLILFTFGLTLICLRFWLMGFSAPSFSPSDNPTAHSDCFLTRLMTFTHLITFNIFLLFCPSTLSFDWSMDAIPLVQHVLDHRNLVSVAILLIILYLSIHLISAVTASSISIASPTSTLKSAANTDPNSKYFCQLVDFNGNACSMDDPNLWAGRISPNTAKSISQCALSKCNADYAHFAYKNKFKGRNLDLGSRLPNSGQITDGHLDQYEMRTALMGFLICVISFLPATNVFFYVGLVVAERVLYLPSVGYCLLIAVGLNRLRLFCNTHLDGIRSILPIIPSFIILLSFCGRTVVRNEDWTNEENLYRSGIPVNPAKAYSNLGNIYAQNGMTYKATLAYQAALSVRPNMADTHYNYGILLQGKGQWTAAAMAYENAIKCRPKMALAYLNLGIVLTSLNEHKEAEKRYLICSDLSSDGLKDPNAQENTKLSCLYNLGRLYVDHNRYEDAINVFQLAIARLNRHYQAHSLFNALGDVFAKVERLREAEEAFKRSLSIKPDHVPAHLTYAHMLTKNGRMKEANHYFEQASILAPSDSTVWQHIGQFYVEMGDHQKSAEAYETAWRLNEDSFESAFGLANAYRNLGKNELAEIFYEKSVRLKPTSSNAHMNCGAMLHLNKKWDHAEREYLIALEIDPNDKLTKENLRKLRRTKSAAQNNSQNLISR